MNPTGIARFSRFVLIPIALAVFVTSAAAQSTYVAGVGFADIKQWDTVQYDPRVLVTSGGTSMDGTSPGGGLRVGTFLHPLWSLEIGLEAEGRTTTTLANPYADLLTLFPTLRSPEFTGSNSFLTVNTVIGFHPAKSGRVRLGYLGGLSFVRGTHRSTLPDFGPFGTVEASFGPAGAVTSIASRPLRLPNPQMTTLRRTDNAVGGLVGFEAAVDMTSRIAIVPGIRGIAFSNQGQTVFMIRPEVGARWTF